MLRASPALPLRIAREHLDDEIMQTIVELLLQSPGKLAVFNLARAEQKNIGVNLRLRRRITYFDFHAFRGGARSKDKQGMLVPREFGAHFFRERVHGRPAVDAVSNSPRAAISAQTSANAAREGVSNRTK